MTKKILTIKNFKKSFGETEVIKGLDFEVYEGEIFAYLGTNGSGKTTTIRCILDIYKADEGEVLIEGKKYDKSYSNHLGYLPEERGIYLDAIVIDVIRFFGELKGLKSKDAENKGIILLEKMGIKDKYKSKIKSLSSGQQQKIQLIITIINNPKILILDEPLKGLDPVNRGLLMNTLMEMKNNGTTILFSSHQMDDVEKIADRILILKDGKIGAYGKIDLVKNSFGGTTIKINYDGNLSENIDLFKILRKENHFAEIISEKGVNDNEIIRYLINNGTLINDYSKSKVSLNEIFIKLSNGINE